MSELARKDRTAADRQRRRRMRQQCGVQVYPIELDPETLRRLVDRGLIAPEDVQSPREGLPFALGAALEELLNANASRRDVPRREALRLQSSKKGA